jgi:hypothetical protein
MGLNNLFFNFNKHLTLIQSQLSFETNKNNLSLSLQ